jgi:hypothetical protein
MMETFKAMSESKRHAVTALTVLLIAFNRKMGLDLSDEVIFVLAGLCATLVGGVSLSDAFGKGKVKEQAKYAQPIQPISPPADPDAG